MKLMSNLSFKNVIKQYEKKYNTKYCETTQELLKKYYDEGIDISSCMDPRIDYLDLEIFLNDLQRGLDVKLYNKVSLSRSQMREIRNGLLRGLDAKVYAKVKYKPNHMRAIRTCLEHGYDPAPILDHRLSMWTVNNILYKMLANDGCVPA